MKEKSKKIEVGIMAFLVTFIWGSSFVLVKIGLSEIPPISFAMVRFLIAGTLMLIISLLRNRWSKITKLIKEDFIALSVLGLTGYTLFFIFAFEGMLFTTASNASIVTNFAPIFIAILSVLFLNEKLNIRRIIGIPMSFLGVLLVVTEGDLANLFSIDKILGDLLIVISAFFWAIYTIYSKPIFEEEDTFAITTMSMILGAIYLIPFAFMLENPSVIIEISLLAWAIIVFLALFGSVVAYLLWNEIVSKIDATLAGTTLFLIPIFTIILAVILIGEIITIFTLIGMILILAGVFLTET